MMWEHNREGHINNHPLFGEIVKQRIVEMP